MTVRAGLIGAAALAAVVSLGAPGSARAQVATAQPSGPPPSWEALIHCAESGDPDAELLCYRAALRAAGYARNPQAAAAERRKHFGLAIPSINLLKHGKKEQPAPTSQAAAPGAAPAPAEAESEADQTEVTVELEELALIPPAGKLLLITTDGGIWEQIDNERVVPQPKKGQSFKIRRTRFGGFFCQFDRTTAVRCVRKH